MIAGEKIMANCKYCNKLKQESWGASCPHFIFGEKADPNEMIDYECKDEEVMKN